MARTKTRRRAQHGAITKAINPGLMQGFQQAPQGNQPVRFGLMDLINASTQTRAAGFWDYRPMARDPRDDNTFGPGHPLTPEPVDQPNRDGSVAPRLWEYPMSWNLPGNQKREVPWQVLREASVGVDIIRRCIEGRKKHVRTLQWAFAVSSDVVEEAYAADPGKGRDNTAGELRERYAAEIKRLTAFWKHPWCNAPGGGWDFGQWVNALMEEYLVLDAVSIYPRKTYGGDLFALEQVDGSTIKPLLDYRGAMPLPPHPAYQQLLYGFPRGEWQASAKYDDDGKLYVPDGYSASELFYHRENARVHSPYGLSAVEQALISARLYIKRQGWLLAEYDDGSTPLTVFTPPADPSLVAEFTPTKRQEWEDAFNAALAGQTRARHRMKVAPPGWEPHQLNTVDQQYRPDFDLFLIKLLAGHFGMTATELGFSETQGLGSSGFAENQSEVAGRVGLKPDVQVLAGIINRLSRAYLNAPEELEFSFIDPASENDAESDGVADAQLKRGAIVLNDDRRRLKLPLYDFPEADMPMLVGVGPSGVIFLEGAKEAADKAAEAAVKQQEATAEGAKGKLEVEHRKIDEDAKARKEDRDFQRETRDSEQEFAREQAETTTKAVTSELQAFATWRKRNPEPKRPFVFKAASPEDFDEPPGPDCADFGDEWLWVTDDMIEKRARSGLDWRAWNAANPTKPKGPNGRWVKVGTLFDHDERKSLLDVLTEESKPQTSPVPQSLGDFRAMAADFNAEVFNAHEFGETWTAAIKGGNDDGPLRWATRDQSGQWTDHRGVRIADEDVPAHLEEMYAQRAELRESRNAYFRSKAPGGPKPKPEYSITRRRDRFTVMGPGGELHEAATRREADAWLKAEKARRAAEEPEAPRVKPKLPRREGKAKRGDVLVAEQKHPDFGGRVEYPVFEVTSVTREGQPRMLRELGWNTAPQPPERILGIDMQRSHLIPGDQIDLQTLREAMQAHTYPGSDTPKTYEDLRELRDALITHLVTKAAEPDPKAEAPADERWPGWAQDLAIAAGVSAALSAALAAGAASLLSVRALANLFADWAQGWQASDPRPDTLTWLKASTDLGPQIERDIRQPIEDAWLEGYFVGTRSAGALVDNAAAGLGPRDAISVDVDWGDWTPGDISAARRIMTEDGSIQPWLDLLRDAGITIKRIAENRLHEVARCLADGLDRGASVDEIARDLQRTINDPAWCYKVAVTETNRAMSAATLDTYELAGLDSSEWMTALDQRVCKRCKANEDAGAVRLGERYPSGDYHPPGHPHCRCALVPSMAALDSLLIVKRAKSGLDWRAWNALHPTRMKDFKGRWERGNGVSLADADPLRTVDESTNQVVDSSTMRRKSYFRVQSGSRDVNDLLKPEEQTSNAWHHHHLDNPETTRRGVSVTESRESLAQYLATTGAGIPYGEEGWLLVELEGDISDDRPLDFEDGEHLIHPTRIVSAQPIPDDFFEMIGNAYDARTDGGW